MKNKGEVRYLEKEPFKEQKLMYIT